MVAATTLKRSFLQMRLGSLVFVVIAMALILAAPGLYLCVSASESVGPIQGSQSGCSSVDVNIDVSNWDKIVDDYGPIDPAIKKIKGQYALFILPLLFTFLSIGLHFYSVDKRLELLALVVACLNSLACGGAEAWYAAGFGVVDGLLGGSSLSAGADSVGASLNIRVYDAGWCAAAAFLFLNAILHATDALMIKRTFINRLEAKPEPSWGSPTPPRQTESMSITFSDYLSLSVPSLSSVFKMFILYWIALLCLNSAMSLNLLPEARMTAPQIIAHHGYPVETVSTTTADGYILELHHITGGRNESTTPKERKPVVFLQHGLEDASTTWVANLPDQSAGFMFADAGFDVWLGNVRGSTYGKRHTYLNPRSQQFWQFSWDEMAAHDLPAMIDTVLDRTGQKNLYYVGHSQGTLMMSAKLSEDPAFASKIKKFFAIAPVSTVHHIGGLLRFLAYPGYFFVSAIEHMFGAGEFIAVKSSFMRIASNIVCFATPGNELCSNLIFLIAGPDSNQLNRTRIPVYFSHAPAGTSTQNILHWAQMVSSGKMEKYDLRNELENCKKYGSFAPPEYDISKITTDTYLFWSDKDWLANSKDISNSFLKKLSPEVLKGSYRLNDFNHLDFVWGMRAAEEVYKPIIEIIKSDWNAQISVEGMQNDGSVLEMPDELELNDNESENVSAFTRSKHFLVDDREHLYKMPVDSLTDVFLQRLVYVYPPLPCTLSDIRSVQMNHLGLPSTPINKEQADKITNVQHDIDSVLGVMRNNIQNVLERDEKLSNLTTRIDMLQSGAGEFAVNARMARRQAERRRLMWRLLVLVLFALLLLYLLHSIVGFDVLWTRSPENDKTMPINHGNVSANQ
ncbi:hypothetical protein QR680_013687 [Steinernema hermaphroditum]|uniref:V-SNARE coiled-coil homology domain-containing protein n=1 Tax=Steinernema hermaphroditum TaxID=289476 RepID=A0AA39I8M8_9BILA|nr:hypothetical protein QR680_013687 [Steinernema hermaphroditum]